MVSKFRVVRNGGFTLIEILIAITILAAIVGVMVSNVNWSTRYAQTTSNKLIADFASIETAMNSYLNDKGQYPSSPAFSDTTFVSPYLFVPMAPSSGFDQTYGAAVTGYSLVLQTGQGAGLNGWYVCAKVTSVASAADKNWLALTATQALLSPTKFYLGASCPGTSNIAVGSLPAAVYPTYWITRY